MPGLKIPGPEVKLVYFRFDYNTLRIVTDYTLKPVKPQRGFFRQTVYSRDMDALGVILTALENLVGGGSSFTGQHGLPV